MIVTMSVLDSAFQLLAGKSVAVVGNGMSLLGRSLGDEIDGHDMVIRMNCGVPGYTDPSSILMPTECIGMRTDILTAGRLELLNRALEYCGPSAVWWMKLTTMGDDELEQFIGQEGVGLCPSEFDLARFDDEFESESTHALGGVSGSTGFRIAMMLALNIPVRSVSLFGFDFFGNSPDGSEFSWWGSYPCPKSRPHDGRIEMEEVVKLGYQFSNGVYRLV